MEQLIKRLYETDKEVRTRSLRSLGMAVQQSADYSESAFRKRLEELDLDPIKVKLMETDEGEGWTREQADRATEEYKKFLFMQYKYRGSPIVPTKLVDKVWHRHILDTLKYAEDCQNIFGNFLHHFPYFGMRGEEDAANLRSSFSATQDMFMREFGAPQLQAFDQAIETPEKSSAKCSGECQSYCGSPPDCTSYSNHGEFSKRKISAHVRPSL